MIISQRIAQDPSFLERGNKVNKNLFKAPSLFDLRMKIIKAVKFIVGNELLYVDGDKRWASEISFELVTGHPYSESEKISDEALFDAYVARHGLYKEFARLPFETVCFENDKGLIYVEKHGEHFKLLPVSPAGVVPCYWISTELLNKQADIGAVDKDAMQYLIQTRDNTCTMSKENLPEDMQTKVCVLANAHAVMVMECLLFANVANSRVPIYTPSKQELKAVPKPLQPDYVYRVLDIFRDRKEYHSMGEVEAVFGRGDKETIHRRAHLVRGHFKKRNGKLFWWNSYMRNLKNIDTVGYVEKDYRFKEPEHA